MSKFNSSSSFEKIIATAEHRSIDTLLDAWHQAAATSNINAYFGCFHTANSRFLGTDASENWTAEEAYTIFKPHFEKSNSAWVYTPIKGSRKIDVIKLGDGTEIAIFDELLYSESFKCRTRGNDTLSLILSSLLLS
jgi:hypothetical protein